MVYYNKHTSKVHVNEDILGCPENGSRNMDQMRVCLSQYVC